MIASRRIVACLGSFAARPPSPRIEYDAAVSLPARISEVLAAWSVPTDVRARLSELYLFLGQPAIDAFIDVIETSGKPPSELVPDDLLVVRARAGERYLQVNHERWLAGEPTPGFWRDRKIEGGPAGLVSPLGDLGAPQDEFASLVAEAAERAAGPNQPKPQGLLLLSRDSHYGNRPGEFSIDLVPSDLAQAQAVNRGVGQQHTLPGSIGEASGTALSDPPVAILWEIQPNIYKPSGERNREANPAWRKHRNWHLMTAVGAFAWLRQNSYRAHVLRSQALHLAHEVNPDKPVSPEIEAMHDRTIDAALAALSLGRHRYEDDADAEALGRVLDLTLSHQRGERALGELIDRVAGSAGEGGRAGA